MKENLAMVNILQRAKGRKPRKKRHGMRENWTSGPPSSPAESLMDTKKTRHPVTQALHQSGAPDIIYVSC